MKNILYLTLGGKQYLIKKGAYKICVLEAIIKMIKSLDEFFHLFNRGNVYQIFGIIHIVGGNKKSMKALQTVCLLCEHIYASKGGIFLAKKKEFWWRKKQTPRRIRWLAGRDTRGKKGSTNRSDTNVRAHGARVP